MTDKAISPLRRRLIEDMAIRRLSSKTQLHYIRHVKRFADFLGRSADKATAEDVHRYQLWLASIGTTVPTVNVSATALRFFFKVTLKRHDLAEEVVSTREPRRLPVVLSPEEVGRLLASATNIKHKALLSLAYATGLRASEVVSLKLTDIDRDRMVIRVEQGKGKKDRYVILSPILLEILREWWRVARKKGWMSPGQPWLFPGYRGQHTSARQLHRIVRLAAGRAGITKRVGVHTLRHSFATHLLEQKNRYPRYPGSARTQEARHDGALHPRRPQRARPGDEPARLPVKDARLTRGRCRGRRSRWRTSSATAGRLGVRPMPAM
jgi:site-specific recombinase XerD